MSLSQQRNTIASRCFFIFLMIHFITTQTQAFYKYDSSYAFMEVRNSAPDSISAPSTQTFCVNFQHYRKRELPLSAEAAKPLYIGWWGMRPNETDVCLPNKEHFDKYQIVPAMYRTQWSRMSSCRSYKGFNATNRLVEFQVNITKHIGSVSNLLFLVDRGKFNYYGVHDFLFSYFQNPEINDTDFSTTVFYIYNSVFQNDILPLINKNPVGPSSPTELRFYRPQSTLPVDAGICILWIMAVGTISIGSLWAASEARSKIQSDFTIGDEGQSSSTRTGDSTQSTSTSTFTTTNQNEQSAIIILAEGEDDQSSNKGRSRNSKNTAVDASEQLAQMSTCSHCIYVMVLLALVVLILMLSFYFRSYAVWFFNIFLAFVGVSCISNCIYNGFYCRLLGGHDIELFSLSQCLPRAFFSRDEDDGLIGWFTSRRCWHRQFRIVSSLIFAASLSFCALWFLNRHHPNAYFAMNFINICLCVFAVKSSNIRSLRLLTFLLLAMFVYDLFMVFGTRLFFDGCSVMLEVVSGVDCASAKSGGPDVVSHNYPTPPIDSVLPEKIPLLFYIPLLSDPMGSCFDVSVEMEYRHIMLGLGDVIIPGYFIAFCFWLDVARGRGRRTYSLIAITGYALGLVTTFVALKLMKTGQPALIYLVPFTLGPILTCAWIEGILRTLWSGENDVLYKKQSSM